MTAQHENNLCIENKKLAITLFSKTTNIKELYFRLRDILSFLSLDLKHTELTFSTAEPTHSYEHPVNLNKIILGSKEIGIMGIVHPVVNKNIDKKGNVVFAELDVDMFAESADKGITYNEPSKYPSMEYDLSLDIPAEIFYSNLKKCWDDEGKDILRNVSVIDTYDTETIHRITIRFEFSSNERTLSSAEVQEIIDNITANLSKINVTIPNYSS